MIATNATKHITNIIYGLKFGTVSLQKLFGISWNFLENSLKFKIQKLLEIASFCAKLYHFRCYQHEGEVIAFIIISCDLKPPWFLSYDNLEDCDNSKDGVIEKLLEFLQLIL